MNRIQLPVLETLTEHLSNETLAALICCNKWLYNHRFIIAKKMHLSLEESTRAYSLLLDGVEWLKYVHCMKIQLDSPRLDLLGSVSTLDLTRCTGIRDVSPLATVKNLNLSLTDVSDVSSLSRLQELDLSCCYRVRDVSMLGRLRKLVLFNCHDVIGLSHLRDVYDLTLTHIRRLNGDWEVSRPHRRSSQAPSSRRRRRTKSQTVVSLAEET